MTTALGCLSQCPNTLLVYANAFCPFRKFLGSRYFKVTLKTGWNYTVNIKANIIANIIQRKQGAQVLLNIFGKIHLLVLYFPMSTFPN